ncbi:Re/Si-specific NAD(P)(+) transhydrogenase subunit beta [Enterobacteriaceae endosymbiont of Donacia crassipes]|uniref:NAD(P)(+) transhydrogenase (Re/Si-specific) subunit beta n=1 Tax=Enterobacteriaceae endosymbiont of Donacia crassipes TaxID=2675776 RepID=UPI0014498D87|nr:NAD(P)(+) transhydrogenase (Re/Si-specific) subunit beta [Enterobacteriaceae endosymbiont of Donacia crassipes]QJC34392.1 Re/Si-specific NAD(P)(+) transhydrogenase subunit beta [Enterobacteriaceae endosymbiont of Donacia crassipes]
MFDRSLIFTYTISAVLFILSIASLSKKETSKKGNIFAINGMLIAIVITILKAKINNIGYILGSIFLGAFIGISISKKIDMTKMPQLIAILHSFVGLTAVLVGFNNYILLIYDKIIFNENISMQLIEIFFSIFIGSITLIGSILAFNKLSGLIKSKTLNLKFKNQINLLIILISFILMIIFLNTYNVKLQIIVLGLIFLISLIFGFHLIMSIGGADMPVVISMLNSYSGWAAASSGFMLTNDLLIITGALVGSSGAILSYLMCKGMNRSFFNVLLGNSNKINNQNSNSTLVKTNIQSYKEISIDNTVEILKSSNNIIIVPGYGLAVSQAQYPLSEIVNKLTQLNIKVRFAIHPVAGRLPGHMNVLLAEANIPYNMVYEMDDINKDFTNTDTVLVIGANDTVNPLAQENIDSPISGMPILEVWKANNIIILKRSMNQGYAGINNLLFYQDNSYMLFGDAKNSINKILKKF